MRAVRTEHRFWCPPDTFWWRSLYKRTKYCRTTYRDKHGGLFIYVLGNGDTHRQAPSLYEEGSFFQLTKPTKRSFYLVFIWIFAAVPISKSTTPTELQSRSFIHLAVSGTIPTTCDSRTFLLANSLFLHKTSPSCVHFGNSVTVSTDIAPGANSGPQRRRRTQRMNTTLCVTSSRVPQIDANKTAPCFPPVSSREQTETGAAGAVFRKHRQPVQRPAGRPAYLWQTVWVLMELIKNMWQTFRQA